MRRPPLVIFSLLEKIDAFVRSKIEIFLFILGLSAASLFLSYFNGLRFNLELPFEFLVGAVILLSLVLTVFYIRISKKHISAFALATLYLVSFAMLTIYSFRYDIFGGPDTIGEYVIATQTLNQGRWPIESLSIGVGDRAGRYASCLSVTVFPAAISSVSGMHMLDIFKFILPAICAFVPIVSYLIVFEFLEDKKIAFLCAALVSISHLQIFMLSYLFREQIANLFLLLSLYLLLKFQKKHVPISTTMLLGIMLLGVTFSNGGHATSDFSFLLVAGFLIVAIFSLLKGKDVCWLPWKTLIAYPIVTILFLYLFVRPLFNQHSNIIANVVLDLVKYFPTYLEKLFSGGRIVPSQSLLTNGLAVSTLLYYWYYVSVILAAVGLLSAFLMFKKNEKKLPIVAYYFLMCSLFIFCVLAPEFIPALGAERVFADPIFPIFIGLSISVPYLLTAKKNIRVFKYFSLLATIFLFLSLPMNLSLVDHQRVLHFHSENAIPPEIRAGYFDVSFSEYVFADFISSYLPNRSWISVDQIGFDIAYLADHVNKTYQSYPRYSAQSTFFILHNLYIDNNIWVTPYKQSPYPSVNVTWQDIIANNSIVASNGRIFLVTDSSKLTK